MSQTLYMYIVKDMKIKKW